MSQPCSHSLLDALLRRAATPGWRRHLAYLLAGLALTLRLVRPSILPPPASGLTVAAGLLALVVLLVVAIGPLLALMQPLFKMMGLLPGWALALLGVGALFAGLHRKGRRFLQMEARACQAA